MEVTPAESLASSKMLRPFLQRRCLLQRLQAVALLCAALSVRFQCCLCEQVLSSQCIARFKLRTWGHPDTNIPAAVQDQLIEIVEVFSQNRAFAALRADGSVIVWGDRSHGGFGYGFGAPAGVRGQLVSVQTVFGLRMDYNENGAFAALRFDGAVVAWGSDRHGGDATSVQGKLVSVHAIYSNNHAFAAVSQNGTVVAWGHSSYGGSCNQVQAQLVSVIFIASTMKAFAALRIDGKIVTWGDAMHAGDSAAVQEELQAIVTVTATRSEFAAVSMTGSVITWGYPPTALEHLNWVSRVKSELSSVTRVYATAYAFTALRQDGSALAWGNEKWGGDARNVQEQLVDVETIFTTVSAFVALRKETCHSTAYTCKPTNLPRLSADMSVIRFAENCEECENTCCEVPRCDNTGPNRSVYGTFLAN